ncbi:hypothetical protein F8O53_10690 [Enterobacter sp. 63]
MKTMTTTPKIRALVCGHTGATGSALIEALTSLPQCESIVAVGRRKNIEQENNPKLIQNVISDMSDMSRTHPDIGAGCNVAFCCIGTTFNDVFKKSKSEEYHSVDFVIATEFAKLTKQGGADFFAIITGDKSDSKSQMRMTRVKGQTEDFVVSLGFNRLAILRPGLLNRGKGRRGWIEQLVTVGGIFGLHVEKLGQSMVWMALHQEGSLKRYETPDIKQTIKKFELSSFM